MSFDIKKAKNISDISFYLEGWRSFLTVQYGYYQVSMATYLLWNVRGTTHTFSIELREVIKHHGSNYVDHFKQTLTVFRDDLLSWMKTGKPEYMEKYKHDFSYMILY